MTISFGPLKALLAAKPYPDGERLEDEPGVEPGYHPVELFLCNPFLLLETLVLKEGGLPSHRALDKDFQHRLPGPRAVVQNQVIVPGCGDFHSEGMCPLNFILMEGMLDVGVLLVACLIDEGHGNLAVASDISPDHRIHG
jgi:hypothetical protein